MSIIKLQAEIDTKSGRIGVGDPNLWEQLGYFMEIVAMLASATVGKNPKNIDTNEDMATYLAEYMTKAMAAARPGLK